MKSIIIHMDDEQHEILSEIKGNRSWRDLLLAHIIPKKTKVILNDG